MLEEYEGNKNGSKKASFVITDPSLPDNPIIYCSSGFSELTQYDKRDVVGKNCRFLQGSKTNKEDQKVIKEAIQSGKEASLCILNYKKDGTIFNNQFFLCPLKNEMEDIIYFIGVQTLVTSNETNQDGANAGWRIFTWL
eukprot:gene12628-16933_t